MPQIRDFAQANKLLSSYKPSDLKSAYTLERMRKLMASLGNPQDKVKVIHVAGTSGKTSTCYYLASLLKEAGQKVGLSVSPHIDEVNERVQINLAPMPEVIFARELGKFIDIVHDTGIKPTYFELLVAFAYWYFAKVKVDYAVIEVGLGGLLDGTNVVKRADKIAVITDIGLDHTHILGQTLPEIAKQKAGIITIHNPVFTHVQNAEVMDVIKRQCSKTHAQLHSVLEHKKSLKLPPFQKKNFNLAYYVYEFLTDRDNLPELKDRQISKAAAIKIPARMEVLTHKGKTLVLDGSHNAQKIEALAEGLNDTFKDKDISAMLGFVSQKEPHIKQALDILLPYVRAIIITEFTGYQDTKQKSIDANKLAKMLYEADYSNFKIIKEPKKAFNELLKTTQPVKLVTGSFYLLNHVRPLIFEKQK